MRRGISAGFAAFNVLALAGLLPGQTNSADSLSKLVLSELPGLDTGPNLASWRRTHAAERLKAPAYDNEYETQGLWCSASVSEIVLPAGSRPREMHSSTFRRGNPVEHFRIERMQIWFSSAGCSRFGINWRIPPIGSL